jgi:hypothetical protein
MPEKTDAYGQAAPKAERPYMPDYGVLDAQSGQGLLPWSWAAERLASARNYWIATARRTDSPYDAGVGRLAGRNLLLAPAPFSEGAQSGSRCEVCRCPEGADGRSSGRHAGVSPILKCSAESPLPSAPSTNGPWYRPGWGTG